MLPLLGVIKHGKVLSVQGVNRRSFDCTHKSANSQLKRTYQHEMLLTYKHEVHYKKKLRQFLCRCNPKVVKRIDKNILNRFRLIREDQKMGWCKPGYLFFYIPGSVSF